MKREQTRSQLTFGGLLRVARESAGIGVRELSRRSGVTAGYLSDIELDRRLPGADATARIEAALGITDGSLAIKGARVRITACLRTIAELRQDIAEIKAKRQEKAS